MIFVAASIALTGCATLSRMINAVPESALQLYSCELLDRVLVTPNEKDVISPSTQWEIDTNPLYQESIGCLPQ